MAITLGCLGIMAAGALTARAQKPKQDLAAAAHELADGIRKVAQKAEQNTVRIGLFTPSGIDDGNSGSAITAALVRELGGFVNPHAVLEVKGSYGFISGKQQPVERVIDPPEDIVAVRYLR